MSALNQIMAAFSAPSGANDPNFANVALLLHGDGTNGSTVLTDSSSAPKTVTSVSGAQILTSDKKFGTGSILVSGGAYALVINSGGATKLTTVSDFTLEFWMKANVAQLSAQAGIWTQDTPASSYSGIMISANTSRQVQFTGSASFTAWNYLFQTIGTYTDGVWHHVAVTRSGTTLRGFFDGVKTLELSVPTLAFDSTNSTLGTYSSFPFSGLIDDFRLTKGVCRYTATFTPPTAAFPDS